jgi:uncharacterized protein (DUF58 family)
MDSLGILSKVKHIRLVSSRLLEGILSGNYRTVFRGPGIEFDEVREYVETDDAKSIDWNVSSRMAMPFTKTFREEREVVLFLLIDVSASMLAGSGGTTKLDTAVITSGLLSYSAVRNNDQVGALFFSDRIEKWVPPAKGNTHASRLVQDMLTISPAGRGSDLAAAIRTAYETLKRRGICIILSDFRTALGLQEMRLLSRRHDVIAVKITDPTDSAFPAESLVELRDPESGEALLTRGKSKSFRKEYREFWQMHEYAWRRGCLRKGVDPLVVSTEDDVVAKLLEFFGSRRRR